MKSLLTACLVASLAVPAAAQFDLFSWSYTPGGVPSSGSVDAGSMWVSGGFGDPLGFQGFKTTVPVAGTVAVTIESYMTWDGLCGASVPVFWENGTMTTLASCSTWGASFEFEVAAGTQIGLGLKTVLQNWPGVVNFTEFRFSPADRFAYWTDLGDGLGGLLGPPMLTGQGLLHAGMPIELHVSNAAPHQPATLIIGLSALEAPFKGGVLVPAPNLVIPAGFIGMGTLELAGTWPANLPPGVQFWMQVWIVDPTAPVGLSATNGLLATAP